MLELALIAVSRSLLEECESVTAIMRIRLMSVYLMQDTVGEANEYQKKVESMQRAIYCSIQNIAKFRAKSSQDAISGRADCSF